MSPIWNVFHRDQTVNPIGQVIANTKEDAEHACDHVIGPHDVDLDRPCEQAPRGNRRGELLEELRNHRQ